MNSESRTSFFGVGLAEFFFDNFLNSFLDIAPLFCPFDFLRELLLVSSFSSAAFFSVISSVSCSSSKFVIRYSMASTTEPLVI